MTTYCIFCLLVSEIIAQSNCDIEKDFASLQKAQFKLHSEGQKEDVKQAASKSREN